MNTRSQSPEGTIPRVTNAAPATSSASERPAVTAE
jgi:hypothetical protein